MYERYYGLRQRPFTLTSNPRYLLLTPAKVSPLVFTLSRPHNVGGLALLLTRALPGL